MTQTTVDVGAAVLKDVERHRSFKPESLIASVSEDIAACIASEVHTTSDPLPYAYHALIEATIDLKQALLEGRHPKARLAYWSILGLIFDVKEMMAAATTDDGN